MRRDFEGRERAPPFSGCSYSVLRLAKADTFSACAVLVPFEFQASSSTKLLLSVVALFCWPRARDFLGVAELQMC